MPTLIPGSLFGMNHYFTLNNSKGSKVFIPIDSVLKDESNPPTASSAPTYPYSTRSGDKYDHDAHKVDPEHTIHLRQQLSEKEGQSEAEFLSEQLKHVGNLELNKKQNTAKRQENQHRSPGRDFDMHKVDVDEQKRFYEEAQHASKQKQQSQLKTNSNFYSSAHQYGERQDQQLVQGSNLDYAGHFCARQQFYSRPVVQQQSQPSSYHYQNALHYQNQSGSQLPYPQLYHPAAEIAHLPGAGIEENLQHHNPPTPSSICHGSTNLEDQVKQLQIDHNSYGNKLIAFNTTVDIHKTDIQKSTERIEVLERALVEIQASHVDLQNQLLFTQKQLSDVNKNDEMLQNNIMDLKNQLSLTQQHLSLTQHQFLDMQKSNEQLQVTNTHLQNQLSLTQQQLLGVQSMMTCSRLWVVSHDQFTIGKEIGRGAWATVHEATFRGATVAAKRLYDEIISPKYVELFHREIQIALHCQHRNIVTFLGVTLEDHPVI